MSRRSRLVQSLLAGVLALLVDLVPVLVIVWAGTSGSVGDLSEVRFLGVGLLFSVLLGVLAALLMHAALGRADASPHLGPLDPWGAFALAAGVYAVVVTAVPALTLGFLLGDEDGSLRDRWWSIVGFWVGGHLAAVGLGVVAGRALLGWQRFPRVGRRPVSSRQSGS